MLNKNQIEMLEFLASTEKDKPKFLGFKFNLKHGNSYNDYMSLVRDGYIESNKTGEWITKKGAQVLAMA